MTNMAKLVGPASAGLVLHKFGAGVCFSANAFSFMSVLASLMMNFPKFTSPSDQKKVILELQEGFTYLRQTPAISLMLLLLACLSLLVLPYDKIIPVFAKAVFNGDAATCG